MLDTAVSRGSFAIPFAKFLVSLAPLTIRIGLPQNPITCAPVRASMKQVQNVCVGCRDDLNDADSQANNRVFAFRL